MELIQDMHVLCQAHYSNIGVDDIYFRFFRNCASSTWNDQRHTVKDLVGG